MAYYYLPNPDSADYQNKDRSILQNKVKSKAKYYLPKIQSLFPSLKFHLYWTKKNTFGYVFADFEKYYRGLIIGKGENALYRLLKDDYVCIILSNKIPDKYSEVYEIDDGKVLRLNIVSFREILSKFGKTSDLVSHVLEESLPSKEELETLKERIERGKVVEKRHSLEKVARFIDAVPENQWADIPKVVDAILRIPEKFKLSYKQISKLISKTEPIPAEKIELSPTEFSKLLDILSKTTPIEFNEQDAPKMIDLLNRFSKIYHIKDREELERVIDLMINFLVENDITKPTDFNRFFDAITRVSTHYHIENPEDLKRIMELCKISDDVIKANYNYFKERLAEFKAKIDDESTLERNIQDFITEHKWLLDFKFWSYDIVEKEKKLVGVGRIDLYLAKKRFKITDISVVEFKKPDEKVTDTKYRGKEKPVITKGVGGALSQTMHYIENLPKHKYDNIEGIVVAGRKTSETDYFIEVFNKYVHQMSIVTYDSLYDKAKEIVDAFTSPVVPIE